MNIFAKLILIFGLLGFSTMAFTEVEKTDTFEIQRQKINELGSSVDVLVQNAKSPLYVQITREDFNYYDGYVNDNPQPSPYFKFETAVAGIGSISSYSMFYGNLHLETEIADAGGTAISRIYGTYTANPWFTPATDKQIIEAKVGIESGTATAPKGYLAVGFSPFESVNGLRTCKTSAFFEYSTLAGSTPGVKTLRAVVVNSQHPTPAVVHDVIIASPFTPTTYPVLRVEVSGTDVKFYKDGLLVSTFVTNIFGSGAAATFNYWTRPIIEFKSYENGEDFYGDLYSVIDYVYVQSEITR